MPTKRKTQKRGRKSVAEKTTAKLSVIGGGAPALPAPPGDLNKDEMEVWNRTVRSEPPDFFSTEVTLSLLGDYCRHRVACDVLSKTISEFKPDWLKLEEGASRYDKLLRMRDREAKAVIRSATKLRLTNQSRYTKGSTATAAGNRTRTAKPWEM